jgi:hypothetical protein
MISAQERSRWWTLAVRVGALDSKDFWNQLTEFFQGRQMHMRVRHFSPEQNDGMKVGVSCTDICHEVKYLILVFGTEDRVDLYRYSKPVLYLLKTSPCRIVTAWVPDTVISCPVAFDTD